MYIYRFYRLSLNDLAGANLMDCETLDTCREWPMEKRCLFLIVFIFFRANIDVSDTGCMSICSVVKLSFDLQWRDILKKPSLLKFFVRFWTFCLYENLSYTIFNNYTTQKLQVREWGNLKYDVWDISLIDMESF